MNAPSEVAAPDAPSVHDGMGLFERYLTLWVALAIGAGIAIGQFAPAVP